ncbi:type IV secretion system DNA-binding domain-containing protein [Candidatus Microgenomates bacterium]|nr:type IV secretion system DNA-binding domain-containing protein [Candidatus Microgenomates bacterium]
MTDSESRTILEVKIPRDTEETLEVASSFFANLISLVGYSLWDRLLFLKKPTIFLEIAVVDQSIHLFVILPQKNASYFESQIAAQYPLAVITPVKDYLAFKNGERLAFGQMVQSAPFYYPLRTWRSFKDSDPLSSILAALSKAGPGEKMIFQMVLTGASSWQNKGWRAMVKDTPDSVRFQTQVTNKLIEQKIGQAGFQVGIRLLTSAKDQERAESLLSSLTGAFGIFSAEANSLTFKKPMLWQKGKLLKSILLRKAAFIPRNHIFNLDEVASLWHPPAGLKVSNLSWIKSMPSEPPENLPVAEDADKENINFFARTEFKNKPTTFGIRREDRRRHIYSIGKTGTGKSTFLANMAISDFRKGEGLAVIDPHGDLSEILLDYIPSFRINDVVYLDPSNQARSFILNPLEVKNPAQKELVVSGIIAIFHKLYAQTWGPRLEHILRNCLFALLDVKGASFLEVPQFLSDKNYRQKIVEKIPDNVIKNFWINEFERMPINLQVEATGPILNKVGQFLSSPLIRNIVGRPQSTIDLEEIMNKGKILILNLSQGRLGEDAAALLGAMFITKFQLAAMSRISIPENERRDFFLYVDEFQNFATTSFIKILSEARKYRLNLVLANQYIAQVSEDVQAAILGNAGTLMSFAVGAGDARRFFYEFDQLYKESDFTSLANHQIIVKLTIEGHISRPFLATTLPLPDCRTQNRVKALQVSQERYTRPLV